MTRPAIAELAAGTRVLVTGAGITGRSVSAALEPTGVRLTICDDDPLALQRLVTPASVVTAAEAVAHIADYDARRHQPRIPAHRTGAGGCGRRGRTDLGRRRTGVAPGRAGGSARRSSGSW